MIFFGPQGNSSAFYADDRRHTWQVMGWLSGMGLNAYEYAYGRGFKVGETTLDKVGEEAQKYGIHTSVEGLYYINLATDRTADLLHYFDESLAVVQGIGAERLAFHPGTLGSLTREEALSNAMNNMKTVVEHVKASGFSNLILCPEIADEKNDIGTLDEIIKLCSVDDCVYPGMDFAHLQAITDGSLKSKSDYASVLDKVKDGVGDEKYKRMHIEFAHAMYSSAGERELLTFEDTTWGPFFEPLAELIAERALEPWCICDSKNTQADDAVKMMKMYKEAQTNVHGR